MLIGHLGVSALEYRYLKADFVPVMVAGIVPDIVDKTMCQILHLTPSGRMMGHTLLGMAVTSLIVGIIWGKQAAWSWALGYLGHLVGDIRNRVPWLYPFLHYDFYPSPSIWETLMRYLHEPITMIPELILCTWAVWACTKGRPKNASIKDDLPDRTQPEKIADPRET